MIGNERSFHLRPAVLSLKREAVIVKSHVPFRK